MDEKFKTILDVVETGDIIFTMNNNSRISKKIGKVSTIKCSGKDCSWSHVALYLGSGKGLIFESAFPKGTQIAYIDKYFKKGYNIQVKRLEGITIDTVSKLKDIVYQKVALNEGYDFLSFFGFVFAKIFKTSKERNNIIDCNREQFCSSIMDEVWKNVGYDFFPNVGEKRITPNDWDRLDCFKSMIIVKE